MDASSSPPSRASERVRSALLALLRRANDHADRALPVPVGRSRLGAVVVVVAQLAALSLFFAAWKQTGAVIAAAPAPAPVQPPTATTRFGLREEQRQAMFRELASAEQAERARAIAANTWGGHAWSREDDLGYVLRDRARSIGQRYGLSLTHAYLVFDEGLRNHWPGPDGQPLPATTAPLSLRTE